MDKCPHCSCTQFYVDKDFNQIVGWFFLGIAIVLVPITYGLSLAILALIDFLMRKHIPSMLVCYQCGHEFKGLSDETMKEFKPFMHHIGLKYDKYR